LTSQASSFADEISGLRQRLADTEAEARKHEDRASRHQTRVKAQQDHLERLRSSLQHTMQTLEDGSSEAEEVEIDELAEA
jgi:regulator of replication initiation timing